MRMTHVTCILMTYPPTSLRLTSLTAKGNHYTLHRQTDILMNAEVLLFQGEELRLSKVVRSIIDSDGNLSGNYNDTPILKTVLYYVQFPNGVIKPYLENLIAENISMQVGADGYHFQLLDGIHYHSKDKISVEKKDRWIVFKLGRQSM